MKHKHNFSAYFSGSCLGLCGLVLALLSACGGGASTDTADAITDAGGAASFPPLTTASFLAPATCDGVMLAGSARWCIGGDGTVKDMSTNFMWLRDGGCSTEVSFKDGKGWAAGLVSGECGLTDASKLGDWAMPESSSALLALTQWTEPVSLKAPGAFTNLNQGYRRANYWGGLEVPAGLSAGLLWLVESAVTFDASAPGYGQYAIDPQKSSYVLPYRKYLDNRATTIENGKSYALAAATALVPIPGLYNGFTRRFVNQIQWQYCCSNAAYVVLWTWDDDSYFRKFRLWSFDSTGDGYFRIRTQGRYIAVENASKSAGTKVIAWPSTSTYDTNDRWQPVLNADNTLYFVNKQSAMCLQWQSNVNDESLVQQNCAPGSPNQSFIAFPRA